MTGRIFVLLLLLSLNFSCYYAACSTLFGLSEDDHCVVQHFTDHNTSIDFPSLGIKRHQVLLHPKVVPDVVKNVACFVGMMPDKDFRKLYKGSGRVI